MEGYFDMKKFLFIFLMFFLFAYITDATEKDDCEQRLATEDAQAPLLSVFPDEKTAQDAVQCLAKKIQQETTSEQFELYENAFKYVKNILTGMLFYKGREEEQPQVILTFLCDFQRFLLFKLRRNQSDEMPNTYKLDTEYPYKKLQQEILKISNIQGRRDERFSLLQASINTQKFFETLSKNKEETNLLRQDFYNLIYSFVQRLKKDTYLMNALNSETFIGDWFDWEAMQGHIITDDSAVPEPYPIPFP